MCVRPGNRAPIGIVLLVGYLMALGLAFAYVYVATYDPLTEEDWLKPASFWFKQALSDFGHVAFVICFPVHIVVWAVAVWLLMPEKALES